MRWMRPRNPDGALPPPKAGVPLAAVAPTQGFRKAALYQRYAQRSWAPMEPTLLCGGDQDPTVFFSVNTQVMAAFWSCRCLRGSITVLDVGGTPAGPFAAIQTGFQTSQAQLFAFYQTAAGGGLSPGSRSSSRS